MINSKEFYNKCDFSYQNIIDDLEKKACRYRKLGFGLISFAKKILGTLFFFVSILIYMYVLQRFFIGFVLLLSKVVELCYRSISIVNDVICLIFKRKMKMAYIISYDVTERGFNYPYKYLKECFHKFEQNAKQPPSKKFMKLYETMEKLYSQIKAAEDLL